MIIALDAMGGDFAPEVTLKGAALALRAFGRSLEVVLVGDESVLRKFLGRMRYPARDIEVVHAPDVIEMSETPTKALRRKPSSSISVGMEMLKRGEVDAFVSAGNTGAVFASSLLRLGRIEGVSRPTIGAFLPTLERACVVLDVGANVDCRPRHLLQFAIMGSLYVSYIYDVPDPRVGLLNIGTEETKGGAVARATYQLLREELPNFIGNIEGGDIFQGKAEVVVCDGIVGNIVLKLAESFYGLVETKGKRHIRRKPLALLGAMLLSPTLHYFRSFLDYQEYGGVPILGTNGVIIIGHGRSSAKAIKNAVGVARKMVNSRINEHIGEEIGKLAAADMVAA